MRCKFLLLGIMGLLLILPVQTLGLDNGYARIVYNISGLQDYQLHWNDRFPPGSILMIYTEADGINHRRYVGVDYVFIIKDSNDNIIDSTVIKNRYQDYRVNDFARYSKTIDNNLDDGVYTADIHIFDLLNDTVIAEYYNNVTGNLLNQSDLPDIPYMNRSNITNNPDLLAVQHKEIIQNFYVDRYADKYPANRFMIQNLSLDKNNIAPGEPVKVGADVINTFYDRGSVSTILTLDNNVVNNVTIDIDPFSTSNLSITIPSEITSNLNYGNHAVELIPLTNYTEGFGLSTLLNVLKKEITTPTQIFYKDINIDKLQVNTSEPVNITVTIQNIGKAGDEPVGILINNAPIEQKLVHFNIEETKDVNFNIAETEPGEYRVTVNNSNLSKIFLVQAAGPTPPAPGVTPQPIETKVPNILLIVGLSILFVFLYMVRRNIKNKLDILERK